MVGRVGSRAVMLVAAGVAASALGAGTASAQEVDQRVCTPPELFDTAACVWVYSYPVTPSPETGSGGGFFVGGVAGASVNTDLTRACLSVTLGIKTHTFCTPEG